MTPIAPATTIPVAARLRRLHQRRPQVSLASRKALTTIFTHY
jgi:hypothetical protein